MADGQVMLSIKVAAPLMERARDAVYYLQGPPEALTLSALASRALARMCGTAERRHGGAFPALPPGYQAGRQGRRPGQPCRGATTRRVFSWSVAEQLRDRAWAVAFGLQEETELATLFEAAMELELRRLKRRHGEYAPRPSGAQLRHGRRIK